MGWLLRRKRYAGPRKSANFTHQASAPLAARTRRRHDRKRMRPGPGLAKVRTPPLTRRREKLLVAIAYGPMREWLEAADIVSEGAVEAGPPAKYFGTTSILLTWATASEATRNATPLERSVLAIDPHLR